ncbi:MAG TPA: flagellar export chaperone FlgN [Candidatus Didemnitutus sp.]|nr:flagellar export chaperone FlgN [Candidatus Didemnitutus sp.]
MNEAWPEIADALRTEIAEYGALLHLFEEQQKQLFARRADAVLRLSGEIEGQVRALHECRRSREEMVGSFATRHGRPGTSTLRSLFPMIAAEVHPLLEALIGEVNVLIHRVRRASRHNQILLARAVEIHQQLLREILPDTFTQTYAPTGRVANTGIGAHGPALRAAG